MLLATIVLHCFKHLAATVTGCVEATTVGSLGWSFFGLFTHLRCMTFTTFNAFWPGFTGMLGVSQALTFETLLFGLHGVARFVLPIAKVC